MVQVYIKVKCDQESLEGERFHIFPAISGLVTAQTLRLNIAQTQGLMTAQNCPKKGEEAIPKKLLSSLRSREGSIKIEIGLTKTSDNAQ